MLKQSIQQRQSLSLSPQQIQIIKLLELPTIQLEQRINEELELNPALDEDINYEQDSEEYSDTNNDENIKEDNDDEFTASDLMPDDDDEMPNYKLYTNNNSKDDNQTEIIHSSHKTFQENLIEQIKYKDLEKNELEIAFFLIGNIDDDGYIRRDLEALVDDLAFSQNISTDLPAIEHVLSKIQTLDPIGVGARNLQECLIIQIKEKTNISNYHSLAYNILLNYFEELSKKHYDTIMSKLNIDETTLKAAVDVIVKLNPKPSSAYNDAHTLSQYVIIPDFIIDVDENEISVSLNARNEPELKINKNFSNLYKSYSKKNDTQSKDTKIFLKQKLDSASFFIDAIRQRNNTMLITMQAIVEFQQDYLHTGDIGKIKPMILKDISELTGLDISTISRVVNSKFAATPYGNKSLKEFFSESLQTTSGEEVSTREVKEILKEAIDKENKKRPLTDMQLAKILNNKGYEISRRTIAKYREQLDIPVSRLRKEIV